MCRTSFIISAFVCICNIRWLISIVHLTHASLAFTTKWHKVMCQDVCLFVSDTRSLDRRRGRTGKSSPTISLVGQCRPPQRGRTTCLYLGSLKTSTKVLKTMRVNILDDSKFGSTSWQHSHSQIEKHVFVIFEVHSIYSKCVLFVSVWGQPKYYAA